jgi:hypothetical protein
MPKIQPTPAQVQTFSDCIEHYRFDMLKASIVQVEDDMPSCVGLMCIETIEDGRFSHAYFEVDGNIVGNWS